jgi:chromosome segregation ATPase
MVEPIMYLGIGFLLAALLGLLFSMLVHQRAVRLTTRRLEAATPLSMAEIQADKDQLRAEFAMSARRLEMSVNQLKAKTTTQLAELGKKSDAINRLKIELTEKTATLASQESRDKAARDKMRATEEEVSNKTLSLQTAEQELAEKKAEIAKLSNELSDRTQVADSRQAELTVLQTQLATLQSRVEAAEKDLGDTRARLEQESAQSRTALNDLGEAHAKFGSLSDKATGLENQLAAQKADAEQMGRRAAEMEERLAAQQKVIAEREHENDLLRQQIELAQKTEQELRAIAVTNQLGTVEKLRSEKMTLEDQLRIAREECSKLQIDLNSIKQQTESSWASERMENAVLRERINDIASEVAKLAGTIEGPNSPIETILAADAAAVPTAPAAVAPDTNGDATVKPEITGSLAERIRALQSHASRAQRAS